MPKVKHRHRYIVVADDGREFEVAHGPPADWADLVVKDLPGGGAVVGYLVVDEDCPNPLEECDGLGQIIRFDQGSKERARGAALLGYTADGVRDPDLTPDPLAVPLDKLEHGTEHWYVSTGWDHPADPGGWDTSRCAGVFVPDESLLDHIKSEARGRAEKAGTRDDPAAVAALEREVAEECAEQACEQYDAYVNGDCWTVCVDVFDRVGERLAGDACAGHVTLEWAERALAEAVEENFKEAS